MKRNNKKYSSPSPLGQATAQSKAPLIIVGHFYPTAADRAFFAPGAPDEHDVMSSVETTVARHIIAEGRKIEMRDVRRAGYQTWLDTFELPDCWISRYDYTGRAPLLTDPKIRQSFGLPSQPLGHDSRLARLAACLTDEDTTLRTIRRAFQKRTSVDQTFRPSIEKIVEGQVTGHWCAVWRFFLFLSRMEQLPPLATLMVLQHADRALADYGVGRAASVLLQRYACTPKLAEELHSTKPLDDSPMLQAFLRKLVQFETGGSFKN